MNNIKNQKEKEQERIEQNKKYQEEKELLEKEAREREQIDAIGTSIDSVSRRARKRGQIITESEKREEQIKLQKEEEIRKKKEKKNAAASAINNDGSKTQENKTLAAKKKQEQEDKQRKEIEEREKECTFDYMDDNSFILSSISDDYIPEQQKYPYHIGTLLHYLLCRLAYNHKKYNLGVQLCSELINSINDINDYMQSPVTSVVYHLYAQQHEHNNTQSEIRTEQLNMYTKAACEYNTHGQAMLIVCILRSFIMDRQYISADTFLQTIQFPPTNTVGTSVHTRYLYYKSFIDAVTLRYDRSLDNIAEAQRKAPTNTGLGFYRQCSKQYIFCEQQIGEIPQLSILYTLALQTKDLQYYRDVFNAVRSGNVVKYKQVMSDPYAKEVFEQDCLYGLALRLHQAVIKAALRRIVMVYEKMYLSDVAKRIGVENLDDVNAICAKAISDGIIEAKIDSKNLILLAIPKVDLYQSPHPRFAFTERISHCLELYNDILKSMRYPDTVYRDEHQEKLERKRDDAMRRLVESRRARK